MPRAMCILGLVVAALLLVLFGLDLAMGVPFGGLGALSNGAFLFVALVLAYLSWSTLRELR